MIYGSKFVIYDTRTNLYLKLDTPDDLFMTEDKLKAWNTSIADKALSKLQEIQHYFANQEWVTRYLIVTER